MKTKKTPNLEVEVEMEKKVDTSSTEDFFFDSTEERIVSTVKENLRVIRHIRGLSLDKLSAKCGVSRAMLSQIEQGKSTPTIAVLWKIANGLNVPFSELIKEKDSEGVHLLKQEQTKVLYSSSKEFSSRALFPFTGPRKTEFYELVLKPGGTEIAEPHQMGTIENLVVAKGQLRLRVGEKIIDMEEKDSIFFKADVPHEYSNPGKQETIMYLVMTYAIDMN